MLQSFRLPVTRYLSVTNDCETTLTRRNRNEASIRQRLPFSALKHKKKKTGLRRLRRRLEHPSAEKRPDRCLNRQTIAFIDNSVDCKGFVEVNLRPVTTLEARPTNQTIQ